MADNNEAAFENSVTPLDDDARELISILHTRVIADGYIPFISVVGKKADNYKIEYKKSKSTGLLYIARIDGGKLILRCKLFHLDEYCDLLGGLSETAKRGLLSSKSCVSDGGCKGPVSFALDGKEYSLCRHSIQLKNVASADADSIWDLLKAEIRYSTEARKD